MGALGAAVPAAALLSACAAGPTATPGVVAAVGAENQYADVLSQVGGRYVEVSSVLDDPNSDPHGFELSTSVAKEVGAAALVVQNGLGYDDFMTKIESATPNPRRRVLVVQHLLGLPDATRNPHLWYAPTTMPAVARAVAGALAALEPDHAAYFRARLERFDASLQPWRSAVAAFEARYRGVAVATTEPVADDLLEAMGADNRTPFAFQAAVMNGVDPSPQDISLVHGLLTGHRVRVLCVDAQVVSSLTASIRRTALRAGVPVVAVYETMPAPGYDFQRWMLAEVRAVERAVAGGVSTERL
ncbi:MAG: zinc ABC transporter substrate-binding protein [Acidobacteriota bacterium]|nr:zinc ABC transporter substrate-binding protein [Acidobacteriota bacterium]